MQVNELISQITVQLLRLKYQRVNVKYQSYPPLFLGRLSLRIFKSLRRASNASKRCFVHS